jgi:flagellar secretion chaperone FliS
MTSPRGLSVYQELDVMAMTPARRVVCIYAFVLSNLRQGARAIAARDLEAKSRHLCRALEGIQELLSALDREAGGDLAGRLAGLYAFFGSEIVAVDRLMETDRLERLIGMIASLHEAWGQAAVSFERRPEVTIAG